MFQNWHRSGYKDIRQFWNKLPLFILHRGNRFQYNLISNSMEKGVEDKESYYARHKQERKEYQRNYRYTHLEEVRKKDRERKRRTPLHRRLVTFSHNVSVSFD
jgi:hypothetical protein